MHRGFEGGVEMSTLRMRGCWEGAGGIGWDCPPIQYSSLLTRAFTPPHTPPTNPLLALTPHLDSGALGETEVITMLFLPGTGAPGVADNGRLIEAGI